MQIKLSKIIIIEGLWGVGKSTVISSVRRSSSVLFIPEPNYIEAGIKTNITEWYQSQHIKRMELSRKYCDYGENTILERSILSSVAFYYAQYRSVPKWLDSFMVELFSLSNVHILFFYNSKKSFLSKLSEIKDEKVVWAVSKNKKFYENYVYFYTDVAPGLIKHKVISMKISKDRCLALKDRKYIDELLDDSHNSIEKKLDEINIYCASAVVFCDNKFLTLYSRNHRQYAFPQGHCEEGEELSDTIIREIREETGFKNVEIIQPLTTYGYRFYDKGKITHKIITCFLVQLQSFKKIKKQFETHEAYINYFFTATDIIKKLSWAEDKEMIVLAQKVILKNKKPSL